MVSIDFDHEEIGLIEHLLQDYLRKFRNDDIVKNSLRRAVEIYRKIVESKKAEDTKLQDEIDQVLGIGL